MLRKRKRKIRKRRIKKNIKIFMIIILIIIIIFGNAPIISQRLKLLKKIKREVTIELGAKITKDDFLKESIEEIEFVQDITSFHEVGKYKVNIIIEGYEFTIKLNIVDTTPPKIEIQNLKIYRGDELPSINDFVVSVEELSDYIIENTNIPDTVGEHDIEIVAKDRYGNVTKKSAILEIIEDQESPIFDGLTDISIDVGNYVDLKEGVIAFDSRDGSVSFTVNDSEVNYKEPGTYIIYYEAVDLDGNTTKATRKITIMPTDITVMINDFPTYHQYPDYPNGCESAALYNLLRYYHVSVTMEEIVNELKKGDGPYQIDNTLYGGDPEQEFVGDPKSPNGYGVYQKPIIDVANKFKDGIIDYTGHSLSDVLELVSKKIPVQVWASIKLRDTKVCASWIYKPTGKTIDWICDLHSMVIVGYNRKSIIVSDSYTGNIEKYDREQFEKIYNLFGQRAIYYNN